MKKQIAIALLLALTVGLTGCGRRGNNNADETPKADATQVLTTIWNALDESKKFPVFGGDMENMVDSAPGSYNLSDPGITTVLQVPEDQVGKIDQAASLMHAMMANHFTGGVFHLVSGKDATAFVEAMKVRIHNAQWICGTPEKMMIAVIGGDYVLAAFGLTDNITALENALASAYPDAKVVYSEAILI